MKKMMILCGVLIGLITINVYADTSYSDMGYSIELDEEVWTRISPETIQSFSDEYIDFLGSQGMDEAYFENFDERTVEMFVDESLEYGNFVVRIISEENSEGLVLADYLTECEEVLVPYYENAGCTIVMDPDYLEINEREWVGIGIGVADREIYQYMTVNEYTGRWYNMSFTRVPEDEITAVLESFTFIAEEIDDEIKGDGSVLERVLKIIGEEVEINEEEFEDISEKISEEIANSNIKLS